MKFRCQCAPVVALLLILLLAETLAGQTTATGGLTGTVIDATSRVVPNATVELRNTANDTLQEAQTDAGGFYLFSFLLPGNYVLKVMHPGLKTTAITVEVLLGPPRTINVKLPVAPISESVTVKGELPPFNAENGDSSTTITQLQVSEVPNPGNDLTYIAQLAPGVAMNTDANGPAITLGNFSSLGMPGISNLFTLNGMNYNDMGFSVNMTGASFMSLGQNQIQEATVVSNGYSGQFGLYAGANVNYVSKSGGNEFHGNATYYWNGSVFNANNWFNNANGVARPFDIANQWARLVWRPNQKGHTFFFFDTEGLELLIPSAPFPIVMPSPQFKAATIANIDSIFGPTSASDAFYKQIFRLYNTTPGATRATPGAPDDPLGCGGFQGPNGLGSTVPCAVSFESNVTGQPTREFLLSGRLDWNVGTKDRAFLLVQYDVGRQPTNSDPINPAFNATTNRPWWQGQFLENHAFGPSVSNQFTIGAYWASLVFKLVNPSQAYSTFPTVLSWESSGLSFTDLGGLDWLIPNGKNATQYQIADDLSVVRGKHKLGFGEYFLRDDWTLLPPTRNRVGILSPQTLDAFYQGGVDLASPGNDYTQLIQSFGSSGSQHVAFYNLALYAQDEWHVRPNLTLTVTLRGEHQSNPICHERCFARLAGSFASISHDPNQPYNQAILVNQKQAYEEISNILWLPRFGFAWQPFGVSHNTVLRGGAGIFYDPLPANLVLNFRANAPLFNQFTVIGNNLTPNETSSLFKDAANSNAAFVEGFASGATLREIRAQIPQFFPPAFNNSTHFINSPQYQKWSLELQQALGPSTTLSVGYFGHHGIHLLIQNPSANAWGFASFPARLCTDQLVRPCADPRFSQVMELSSVAISNYDGMVVSFQHRFGQGILQANYTYSHALDEASNGGLGFSFTSASSIYPQDPNNIRGSYGSAEFDVRHSFNASYVWQLPIRRMLRGHRPGLLLDGWEIAGTIFARTGFPYTVFDGLEASRLNTNNFYGPIYAVPAAPVGSAVSCGAGAAFPPGAHPCQPPQVLADGTTSNPYARFIQSGCETDFNAGNLPGTTGPCSGPLRGICAGSQPLSRSRLLQHRLCHSEGFETTQVGEGNAENRISIL